MKECILRKYKLHEIRDGTISPVSLDTAILLLLENVIFSGIGETPGWSKLYGGTFYKFSSRYSVTFAWRSFYYSTSSIVASQFRVPQIQDAESILISFRPRWYTMTRDK